MGGFNSKIGGPEVVPPVVRRRPTVVRGGGGFRGHGSEIEEDMIVGCELVSRMVPLIYSVGV